MPVDLTSSSCARRSPGDVRVLAGHAAQAPGCQNALRVVGQEREHCLPQRTCVPRDDDADLGQLPAAVRPRLVVPFTMADLGMISLAFGTIVIAIVYALGHVRGAHINPAVRSGDGRRLLGGAATIPYAGRPRSSRCRRGPLGSAV